MKGKQLQIGSGSRRRNVAKAEDVARRSRKRAARREAFRFEARA
jgi:hypothetical protein